MRAWIWVALLITAPVPYFLPEVESAPVLRLGFLTALMTAVYVAEGAGALLMVWVLAVAQLLLWSAFAWLVAAVAARGLAHLVPGTRTAITLAIVALLGIASLFEIYSTPLSSTRMRSNLLQLFE